MMRWIVGTSLRFRFLVGRRRTGAAGARRRPGPGHAGRRLPGVRAAAGRDADRVHRAVGRGGRGARSPCRWSRTLQRRARARRDALQVGRPALVDRADLRARHRPAWRRGSWSQERLQLDGADAADLGGAAGHASSRSSSTSRVMKIGLSSDELSQIDLSMIAYWNDPRPTDAASPAWPTWRSGASASSMPGPGRPRTAASASGVTLDEVMTVDLGRARRRPAEVHRRRARRHRRLRRHAQPAARRSGTSCRSSTRPSSARGDVTRAAAATPSGSATSPTSWRATSR